MALTDIQALEDLAVAHERSTLGPWVLEDGILYGSIEQDTSFLVCDMTGGVDAAVCEQDLFNADFIIKAHAAMGPLLGCALVLQSIADPSQEFSSIEDAETLVVCMQEKAKAALALFDALVTVKE